MNGLQRFLDEMNNWGWTVNARMKFNKFLDAIESESGLVKEIQSILSIIDDIVLDKERRQFEISLAAGTEFYRARIIEPSDYDKPEKGVGITEDNKFEGYNAANSREPLLGIAREGRNNIAGASYLYVASNPETACMEVKSQFADLISLAKFKLLKPLSVIDFGSEKTFSRTETEHYGLSMGKLFTLLMMQFTQPVKEKNAYRATQVVADHLRKTGIDGIKYRSFLSPDGMNYTIFNCHDQTIEFCGSKVLLHKQANHSFWDFNDEIAIMSNKKKETLNYDKELVGGVRQDLSQSFKKKRREY